MIGKKLHLEEIITYTQSIVDTIRDPLIILNADLSVHSANRAFYREFQVTSEETEHLSLMALSEGVWNIPELVTLLTDLTDPVTSREAFDNLEVTGVFPGIGGRVMLLNGRKLLRPGNRRTLLVLSMEDITARKAEERENSHDRIQDKKIALALQRTMLFRPREDAFSGLSVHTGYAVASEEALVGGDFWDTFAFNNEHAALVLGDVMGHGLQSAIFTAELRYVMRAYVREHVEPARILHHMNQYLCQSNRLFQEGINTEGSDAPVCIAIAILVRATGAGILATAGMEPPLLVRADGETELSAAGGLPLGIMDGEEYEQIDFQMEVGDTLVLSTDGVTEARAPRTEARQGPEFLDTVGLARLAVAGNGGTLTAMADTILSGARAFAGGTLRDDASLVLVRRVAVSPQRNVDTRT